jgi:hypothetical protein
MELLDRLTAIEDDTPSRWTKHVKNGLRTHHNTTGVDVELSGNPDNPLRPRVIKTGEKTARAITG